VVLFLLHLLVLNEVKKVVPTQGQRIDLYFEKGDTV
jgi:hypothetical protein